MIFIYIIFSIVIIAADRISKIFAEKLMGEAAKNVITGVISFSYTENTGAAFSILSGMTWLLSAISVIFCVGVIVYWMVKKPVSKLLCTSLAMIFAGALANAADRIFYGYVIDFIKLDFINFPIFNIADIAITIGAVLLMIYVIFFDGDDVRQGVKN